VLAVSPMTHVRIGSVDAEVASDLFARMKGLLGRSSLAPGTGLLIERCNCIHTLFMRFSIDATFLDRHDRVVRVVRGIPPGRWWVWGGWRAVKVLETASAVETK
jgi:uncharacterized membrane protein (UPF0127 family)